MKRLTMDADPSILQQTIGPVDKIQIRLVMEVTTTHETGTATGQEQVLHLTLTQKMLDHMTAGPDPLLVELATEITKLMLINLPNKLKKYIENL